MASDELPSEFACAVQQFLISKQPFNFARHSFLGNKLISSCPACLAGGLPVVGSDNPGKIAPVRKRYNRLARGHCFERESACADGNINLFNQRGNVIARPYVTDKFLAALVVRFLHFFLYLCP